MLCRPLENAVLVCGVILCILSSAVGIIERTAKLQNRAEKKKKYNKKLERKKRAAERVAEKEHLGAMYTEFPGVYVKYVHEVHDFGMPASCIEFVLTLCKPRLTGTTFCQVIV